MQLYKTGNMAPQVSFYLFQLAQTGVRLQGVNVIFLPQVGYGYYRDVADSLFVIDTTGRAGIVLGMRQTLYFIYTRKSLERKVFVVPDGYAPVFVPQSFAYPLVKMRRGFL